jgi:hypothetical protein
VPFPREKRSKRLKIQVEVSIPMETGELEGEYALVARKFIVTERSGVRVIRSLPR